MTGLQLHKIGINCQSSRLHKTFKKQQISLRNYYETTDVQNAFMKAQKCDKIETLEDLCRLKLPVTFSDKRDLSR